MKKIFMGMTDICGMVKLLSEQFRKLDFEVTTAVHSVKKESDRSCYTYVCGSQMSLSMVERIISEHDYFVFLYGTSLLENNEDFKIIKARGKKIISILVGNDVRHTPSWERQNNYSWEQLSENPRPFYCAEAYTNTLIYKIRMAELYSCGIYSQPNVMNMGIRPYKHLYMPLDLSRFSEKRVDDRAVPVVVHAPSDADIKGTACLLQALTNLRKRGVQFVLQVLKNVDNNEVLNSLKNADCVIDQLFPSEGGLFAREAMASGCAVASVLDCYTENCKDLPIFPLHLITLEEDLAHFLQDVTLRKDLVRRGYSYVKKNHDPMKICKNILKTFSFCEKEEQDFVPLYYRKYFYLDRTEVLNSINKNLTSQVLQKVHVTRDEIVSLAHKGLCDLLCNENIENTNLSMTEIIWNQVSKFSVKNLILKEEIVDFPDSIMNKIELCLFTEAVLLYFEKYENKLNEEGPYLFLFWILLLGAGEKKIEEKVRHLLLKKSIIKSREGKCILAYFAFVENNKQFHELISSIQESTSNIRHDVKAVLHPDETQNFFVLHAKESEETYAMQFFCSEWMNNISIGLVIWITYFCCMFSGIDVSIVGHEKYSIFRYLKTFSADAINNE